jgi:cell division protein FtsB
LFLLIVLGLLQVSLWVGKGGWLDAMELEGKAAAIKTKNETLSARNDKMKTEVTDLRDGTEAIEERARFDLGMLKDGEIYVQLPEQDMASKAHPQ